MSQPVLFRQLTAVTDPLRCRMLRILCRSELTVSELCAVLQLPQSTVSRHLKTLLDDGWVVTRRDGTSRYYSMPAGELPAPVHDLWAIVEGQLQAMPAVRQDDSRVSSILASRRTRSREFFSSTADQWDRLREELYGRSFQLLALPALLDERWVVGDLGCGTGAITAVLAPYVQRVVAVDGSEEMLETARRRLETTANVDLRRGDLESLPVQDRELDAAILFLVLHFVPDPARVLKEAARALCPEGRLLVVDMLPHEHEEYRKEMGHVWLGFAEHQILRLLAQAGFAGGRVHPLPASPDARGPSLFTAGARREM